MSLFLLTVVLSWVCCEIREIRGNEYFGFGSEVEERLLHDSKSSNNEIVGIFTSSRQEFIIVCHSHSVLFYRVLTYPNLYPYNPYLFYGYYKSDDLRTVKSCFLHSINDSLVLITEDNEVMTLEKRRTSKVEDYSFKIVFELDQHTDRWEKIGPSIPFDDIIDEDHGLEPILNEKEEIKTIEVRISPSHKTSSSGYSASHQNQSRLISAFFVDENDKSTVAILDWKEDHYEIYFRLKNISGPHYAYIIKCYIESAEITAMAIFRYQTPYICLGTSDGRWFLFELTQILVPSLYEHYPLIGDFYLPPSPDFYPRGQLIRELDDSSRISSFRFLSIFCAVFILWIVLGHLRLKLYSCRWIKRYDQTLYYITLTIMISFSIVEVFTNQDLHLIDFPAYIRHIEQLFFGEKGTFLRYEHVMHYHGPCTYGAGFLLLYFPLYACWKFLFSGVCGILTYFRIIWVAFEILLWMLLRSVFCALDISNTFVLILSIVSNRLHLYNTRVLINDLPGVILEFFIFRMIIQKAKYSTIKVSILYGLLLSYKLNFIFILPPLLAIFFHENGFNESLVSFFVIFGMQILLALPMLISSWSLDYFRNAFDFTRDLLWDKTRTYTFVGRKDFSSPWFKISLLLCISLFNLLFTLRYLFFQNVDSTFNDNNHNGGLRSKKKKIRRMVRKRRRMYYFFFMFNFVCIAFAKGLYTPFLCWFFYSLPMLLEISGFSFLQTLFLFLGTEICFRRNPSKEVEKVYSVVLFSLFFSVVFDSALRFVSDILVLRMKKLRKRDN